MDNKENLAKLPIDNKKLVFQYQEKERREAELLSVNKELVFQNEEKEKRAAELVFANKELVFQNKEKEKRAAELLSVHKELVFQNEEKEKRAAELVFANKELVFQNKEKEKRAAELAIANLELSFQNEEKKKRANELTDSNKEMNELEKRVKERTEELESFSYSVSHDLRTPLRAINGYAQILEEDYNKVLGVEGNRLLGEVRSNAIKMGVLIDDLLTFSRLGRKGISKSNVDINKLVATALSDINQSVTHNAHIKYDNLIPANGDYNLLQHVFNNLLSNAIKYSAKNKTPRIEIRSVRKNGFLIYAISDNGVGFDMQYVGKLFGVFQRLHGNEEFSGNGVGLAIVKRIIQKHDGNLWAEGIEGEGATFFFSLPEKNKIEN